MFKMSYKEKVVDILGDGVGFRYERCEPCIIPLVETAWYIDKIRIKWQNSVYFFSSCPPPQKINDFSIKTTNTIKNYKTSWKIKN